MGLPRVIERFVTNRRVTLLGVGPMSVNCVDAAIELACDYAVPIMLIASRRQVDCAELGGGYVNNWTTEEFAGYVAARDRKRMTVLARDHGGPWQNPVEIRRGLPLAEAMESAKRSYAADIRAGFRILHIDTSVDIHGRPSAEEVLRRVFELYEFCHAERSGSAARWPSKSAPRSSPAWPTPWPTWSGCSPGSRPSAPRTACPSRTSW